MNGVVHIKNAFSVFHMTIFWDLLREPMELVFAFGVSRFWLLIAIGAGH